MLLSGFECYKCYSQFYWIFDRYALFCKQACIPVGCIPSSAVANCEGGGCLPQCMLRYTDTPLSLGLDTLPRPGPLHCPRPGPGHPPGLGLDTPWLGLNTRQAWAWTPPGPGPEHPPRPRLEHPPGLGLSLDNLRIYTHHRGKGNRGLQRQGNAICYSYRLVKDLYIDQRREYFWKK